MSDEVNTGGSATAGAQDDAIKQVKGEMNRKIDSTNSALAEIRKQNEQIQAHLAALANRAPVQQQAQVDGDKELEETYYKDPVAFAKKIEERTEARIASKMDQAAQVNQRVTQAVSSLAQEYPELGDQASDFYQLAVKKYNALDASDKASPQAYKSVVLETALELGTKPKSKRDPEEFMGPGQGGPSDRRTRKAKEDPATALWAELLQQSTGVDLTSEEAKKRINERAGREWNRYRKPTEIKKGK